jgi:hypothetical protein
MIVLLLALALQAQAATDSANAFEKSYGRDNTFCTHKGKRVEFLIRGGSKFTETHDSGYGELVFFRREDKKPVLMDIASSHADTFRFFLGASPICSKSHGYILDDKTIAVLLLKENKPFLDKLVIQLVDSTTLKPKSFLVTDYAVDKAIIRKNGFAIRSMPENLNREIGKVKIEGQPYVFNEKEFPKWHTYSIKGFENAPEMTFDKFPWRKYFKDIQDFNQTTGWDQASGKFTKDIVFFAVNFNVRKRCILFIDKKRPLTESEQWRCQAM